MRKISTIVLVIFLMTAVFIQSSFAAEDDYGCNMKKSRYYKKDKDKDYDKGMFYSKFYKKAKYALKYKDKIELTDEQADKIMDLKIELKKKMINKKAQIDIILLDIKSELYSDKIDVGRIKKLIDKKYNLKAEETKAAVKAYSSLKNILNDKQLDKLKEILEEKKEYYYKKYKSKKEHSKKKMMHHMMD